MIALRERDTANLGDIFLTIKTFIRYYNEKDDSEFTFLTNSKQLSALDVSNLYNKRWLIKLVLQMLQVAFKIKEF